MNPSIDWQKGMLEWRESISRKTPQKSTTEWYTFIKSLLYEKTPKKQTNQPITMTTEEDKEEYLNQTQNPLLSFSHDFAKQENTT